MSEFNEEGFIYGTSKREWLESVERRRAQDVRDEKAAEVAKWNRFLDAMCGTGLVQKKF